MVRQLYIIGAGEFEISIKTPEDRQEEADSQQLIGYLNRPSTTGQPNAENQNEGRSSQLKQQPVMPSSSGTKQGSQAQQYVSQKIVVVGPGNMLGLEDIARMS